MLRYTIATGKAETDILSEYGVHVSGTTGLIGRPNLKGPKKFDWKHLNGEWVDLRSRRYKPREITMRCWLKGSSKQVAIDKMNTFFKAFGVDSIVRLHVDFVNGDVVQTGMKGLFYLVYLKNATVDKYKWRNGRQIVEFEITLVEPSPVKRVLMVSSTDLGSVTVSCKCPTEIDIHWGDGSVSYDLVGNSISASHAYTTTGTHYVIITGVIADITDFSAVGSNNEITVTQIYGEI